MQDLKVHVSTAKFNFQGSNLNLNMNLMMAISWGFKLNYDVDQSNWSLNKEGKFQFAIQDNKFKLEFWSLGLIVTSHARLKDFYQSLQIGKCLCKECKLRIVDTPAQQFRTVKRDCTKLGRRRPSTRADWQGTRGLDVFLSCMLGLCVL